MAELLATYSMAEIIGFFITAALAIKGIISFFDWAHERLLKYFNKETKKEISENQLKAMQATLDSLTKNIQILLDSDRDQIKAEITKQHHYFCYQKHWIDDYSLDCLERQYSHYVDEGGNSFIESLMKEIRSLPKVEQ